MNKLLIAAVALAAFTAVVGLGNLVLAAEGADEENVVKVTVTGKNYCIAKELKKADEDAKCSLATCRHALKVAKAEDADGEALDMKGWTLHYLYNDASKPLSNDAELSGKELTVVGTVYKAERVLEVETVEETGEEGFDFGDDDDFDAFDYSQGGGSRSGKSK